MAKPTALTLPFLGILSTVQDTDSTQFEVTSNIPFEV